MSKEKAVSLSRLIVTRVEEVWFPDGNLILFAGDRLFRVFLTTLNKKSPILGGIIQFDHGWVSHCRNFIAGVRCLSSKYQIPSLARKALAHLSSMFINVGFARSCRRGQILPVILLARELSLDWILPVAFYHFCLMDATALIDGMEYPKSQQAKAKPKCWLEYGFGFGLRFQKPKPSQQARAWDQCQSQAKPSQTPPGQAKPKPWLQGQAKPRQGSRVALSAADKRRCLQAMLDMCSSGTVDGVAHYRACIKAVLINEIT
ncbi:hypothetical protein B0H10DRAFT_1962415 [Mycena sp. CBHHK59/15]|nr:hypothetical protein B0H10DRAFT_1962415 [Mycena sp. CBHHK59/15]